MQAAVSAGADLVNDVYALRRDGALSTAAGLGVPVCIMHMQGEPQTMQNAPSYENVVEEVFEFLAERVAACRAAGVQDDQIIVDPGFGFGKDLTHNLQLLGSLERFQALELPILAGMSRKSMIGQVLEVPMDQRVAGNLACAVLAVQAGAHIVRVHDVAATVEAMKMVEAVNAAGTPG